MDSVTLVFALSTHSVDAIPRQQLLPLLDLVAKTAAELKSTHPKVSAEVDESAGPKVKVTFSK